MIVNIEDAPALGTQMMQLRSSEQKRLTRISNYMKGKQDPPYAPRGVNAEYRWIQKKSRRNFLPLVVSVISGNLHVDGYRPSGMTTIETASTPDAEPTWQAFRANRMISRQHGVHRAVAEYGAAYVVVLPGQMSTDEELESSDVPVVRPVSPRRMTAFYADDVDDEWPQVAIEVKVAGSPIRPQDQRLIVALYDESARYMLTSDAGVGFGNVADYQVQLRLCNAADPYLNGLDPISLHGLGICPVVRFLYESDLDGERDCSGEVEPIMPIQDQVNFDTFNLMMSEQYAAFRQRWVTGMAPSDELGREPAPFRPGVDRMLAAEDPTTKFGDFAATDLKPYIDVRDSTIQHMSTITQIPPYYLLGQVANLSAEALAAARDGLDRKIQELQSVLTDPWRNVFRLTGLASDDKEAWNDLNGEVIWRDTSARAFSATIDGLGKAAQMLGIPVEELWRRIPGVTADDVNSWLQARQHYEAQDTVKNAIAAAMQSQPQFANITSTTAGVQTSTPVEIQAGTIGQPTGTAPAKSTRPSAGGGGTGVH